MRVSRRGYWRYRSKRARWRKWADILLSFAFLALAALTAARLDQVATYHITGAVRIADGDSLTIDGERVRLRGIDAPEYDQKCELGGRSYPCGKQARQVLAELAGSEPILCSGWERDRYGRLLARCKSGEQDLGRTMVEMGWAVSYGDYKAEEASARQAGKGLWLGSFDNPRVWRERQSAPQEPRHDWVGLIVNFLKQLTGLAE